MNGLDDPKVAIALQRVTQKMGELQGVYNINQEIGQTAGLWQGMWHSPFSTMGLLVSKGLEKGVGVGLPFTLGVLVQELLKLK